MTLPSAQELYAVTEATWPPADRRQLDGWIIRNGDGGGQRVSAATLLRPDQPGLPDIARAEAAMRALDQHPLFMIRDGETALDAALAERGYAIKDPVTQYACPTAILTEKPVPPVSGFAIWPPLAIQRDIWARGGIGKARLRVMERVRGPRTTLLARARDRAAGTAFVAIERKTAMIHAIEVVPALRRNGVGLNILRTAAHWAQDHGATHFSLVVTDANAAANALYLAAGMTAVGKYHYRVRQEQRTI